MKVKDVAIIGAGPAGVACALQFRKFGIYPLLIEKNRVGGLLLNANSIDNHPGFPYGISGIKLSDLFAKQLKNNMIEVLNHKVTEVSHNGKYFHIKLPESEIFASYLVIASGTKPMSDDLYREHELSGRIFYEYYPMRKFENNDIVIVGAGDAAFDYALSLSAKNKVTILNRTDVLKCNEDLKSQVFFNSTINYTPHSVIEKITYENDKLLLTCMFAEKQEQIKADFLLVAIGRVPETGFMDNALKDRSDSLVEEGRLFFIGDVKNGKYRQTAISAGDGVRAAMEIYDNMS